MATCTNVPARVVNRRMRGICRQLRSERGRLLLPCAWQRRTRGICRELRSRPAGIHATIAKNRCGTGWLPWMPSYPNTGWSLSYTRT